MSDETTVEQTGTTPEEIIQEPSQTPVQKELEREEKRNTKTEPEKAAFTLQKVAERAKELGLNPAEILGITTKAPEGTVVTLEMLDARDREKAQKTALQLAEEIPDEHERNLSKLYLQNRIVPTGDPHEDLKLARALVNSVKNSQIAEEMGRRGTPASHSSAPGVPPRQAPKEPELSAEELMFTKPPFNLSKEAIVAARPKQ